MYYFYKKGLIMEILGKVLYLIMLIVFVRFFYFVLKKSFENKNSTTIKIASRGLVFFIFTLAIITLFAYAIFATEMGVTKRFIAGLIGGFISIYFGFIVKKYIRKEAL